MITYRSYLLPLVVLVELEEVTTLLILLKNYLGHLVNRVVL